MASTKNFSGDPFYTSIAWTKHNRELTYYPVAVKLEKCVGSCNTLNDLSNRVWVPNKTEDLNTRF